MHNNTRGPWIWMTLLLPAVACQSGTGLEAPAPPGSDIVPGADAGSMVVDPPPAGCIGDACEDEAPVADTGCRDGTLPVAMHVLINAGADVAHVDAEGLAWDADRAYADGSTVKRTGVTMADGSDPAIYLTERWGLSGYEIPVPEGTYDVRLHFAETYHAAAGERVMALDVEGIVDEGLDVFAAASGANRALVKELQGITVTDGQLSIGLTASVGNTMINAIEVLGETMCLDGEPGADEAPFPTTPPAADVDPTALTPFEQALFDAAERTATDVVKIGPGTEPASETYRYGWRASNVASAALFGGTFENTKYGVGLSNTPGENLLVNVTSIGWIRFESGGYGAGITVETEPGTTYARNIFVDKGLEPQPYGSFNVDGFSCTRSYPNASFKGYNIHFQNLADGGFDAKIDVQVEKATIVNAKRLIRVWGSVRVSFVDADFYLGNGSRFVWLNRATSVAEFHDCRWHTGTPSNPGETYTRVEDIPASYLETDSQNCDGCSYAEQLIDLDEPPAWYDDPFFVQARAVDP